MPLTSLQNDGNLYDDGDEPWKYGASRRRTDEMIFFERYNWSANVE